MEERGNKDSELVEGHTAGRQSAGVADKDDEMYESHKSHHTVREIVACRRNGEGKLASVSGQTMTVETTHHRPTNKSPLRSSPGHLDGTSAQSGTLEDQPDRLHASGTTSESSTDRSEEVIANRVVADSLHGYRVAKSPSDGPLDPYCGPVVIKSPDKEPNHSLYGPLTSSWQSEGLMNRRPTKSPPSAGPTSRVTAFSVSDILDPGKFGRERRESVDHGLVDPRLMAAAGPRRELCSPWMQRLELQLRAGSANMNNFNFLRGIGQY